MEREWVKKTNLWCDEKVTKTDLVLQNKRDKHTQQIHTEKGIFYGLAKVDTTQCCNFLWIKTQCNKRGDENARTNCARANLETGRADYEGGKTFYL